MKNKPCAGCGEVSTIEGVNYMNCRKKKYTHFVNEISGFEEDEQPTLGKLMLHVSLIAVLSILIYLILY